jgi:hypothetical protein
MLQSVDLSFKTDRFSRTSMVELIGGSAGGNTSCFSFYHIHAAGTVLFVLGLP